MALEPRVLRITLDTNNDNHELEQHIMQGSTDTTLEVTLSKDGRVQTPTDSAKTTVYVLYYNDKGEKIGSHAMKDGDTGYNVTIDQTTGVITLPFTEQMSMSAGQSTLHLKVEEGIISYTYTLHYTVDPNPVYNAGVLPSDLPVIEDIENQIANLSSDKANKDLANVDNADFHQKGKDASLVSSWGGSGGDIQDPAIEAKNEALGFVKGVQVSKDGGLPTTTKKLNFKGDITVTPQADSIDIAYDDPELDLSHVPGGHVLIKDPDSEGIKDGGIVVAKTTGDVTFPANARIQSGMLFFGPDATEKTMRVRRDSTTGYLIFDRYVGGQWIEKMRIEDSISVKTVHFLKSDGMPDTPPGALSLFSENMKDSEQGNAKVLRPFFQDDDGTPYAIVAGLPDGQLRVPQNFEAALQDPDNVPLVYKHARFKGDTQDVVQDLSTLTGDDRIPASAVKDLPPPETADSVRTKLESLSGTDRLPASAVKDLTPPDTAEQIRDKLSTLSGDARLPASEVRDIADQVSPSDVVTKLELLTGDGRLDASAVKNIPQGSPDTGPIIRDKLSTLSGDDRLDASKIKNIPSGGTDTAAMIRDKLTGLQGDDRLDASAIKNIPSGGSPDTAEQIRDKLSTLTGIDRLSATAVKDLAVPKYYESATSVTIDSHVTDAVIRFDGTGAVTQTLPLSTDMRQDAHIFVENVKTDDSEVTLQGTGGENVGGANQYSIEPKGWAIFIKDPDTAGWLLEAHHTPSDHGGGGTTGIEVDDGTSDAASITKLNIKGAKLTALPNQGGMGANEAEMTAGIDIHMIAPNQQYGVGLCTEIIVEPPLSVYDDPDSPNDKAARLEIKPGTFEPLHMPSFLAYLDEGEEVIGKMTDYANNPKAHHDGTLFFLDVVKPPGPYISVDKVEKTYGIQEADELDPNITGGTDYLIAFRAHMKGTAPDNGFVRVYLYNKNIDPFEPTGYLEDVNGEPLIAERHYKIGDELGVVEVVGVVNAKGLQSFTCHVVDNFADDTLLLTDRTEGATGLMIQALTSEEKTGDGLQQFELDTAQNLEFSAHYLGPDRMSMGWVNARDDSLKAFSAGTNIESVNGWRLINPNGIKTMVSDGYTTIRDDGAHICDFNWGKIFSAEETVMLRGHDINVSTTLVDKDSGFTVALMKWIGKPDEYTNEIFTTRGGDGNPEFQTNWVKTDSMFVSEDAVSGDHTQAKTMVVPADANNYAIIIYPVEAQQPLTLKLRELKVDVDPAFTGYAIHAPETVGEAHLVYDPEYKEFTQDNQGYAALRYTINDTEIPAPCGVLGKGAADITIDTTVNQVSGSTARGGEGAIKATAEGMLTLHTGLRLSSEKGAGTKSTIKVWYARVVGPPQSPVYEKIDESEGTFEVMGGAKNVQYHMPAFTIQVNPTDRIALRMQGDAVDAAFLESTSPSKPMVHTSATFKELVEAGDDPDGILDATRQDRETAGDVIYTAALRGSAEFAAASSASIVFTNLPDGAIPHIIKAYKKNPDGTIQNTARVEEKFTPSTGTLLVSFGETAETKVLYEVWA